MAYTGEYWDTLDLGAVVSDDVSHSFTMSNKATGAAIDITGWDIYFKASASGGHSTDTIYVTPSSMVKSSSGSGTTDKFTLPIPKASMAVDVGRYNYDIAYDSGSETKVLLRGILTVYDRENAAL